jgi:protein kinase X
VPAVRLICVHNALVVVTHQEALAIKAYFAMYQMALSSFAVGETLGTGTFGRVRLVQCNYHGAAKTFALKMLKKTEIIRLKQVEHIKAEKAILSRISHPFIVNLYATFQDERCIYMIMEYIIGGELFSQLRKEGRFANDVARFYTAEIVLALEYLHAQVSPISS